MPNVEVGGHARGANRAQTSTATGGRGDESHVRIAVADEDRHRPRDQPAVTKPLPPTALRETFTPGYPWQPYPTAS
jgi:hypothetical protein